MKTLCAIILAVLIQACTLPYSKYPLSDPNILIVDTELLGLWHIEEDSNNTYYLIGIDSTDNLFAHQFEQDKDGRIKNIEDIHFHISKIASGEYINLFNRDENAYYIIKYNIESHNTLKFMLLNEEKVKSDILSNKLAGYYEESVSDKFKSDSLLITASTPDLIKYFNSPNNDSLFSEANYLFRLR